MKACVFNLGCKVNEVECASFMTALENEGYETTDTLCAADVYIVNTCAVTAEAEKKSRQAIARVRKCAPNARIVVCGCAAQKNAAAFAGKEGVVAVAGAMRKDLVPQLLRAGGVRQEEESVFCELPPPKQTKTRAFLRVQDGCNNFCSYCIIPYLRGRARSRKAASVVREAGSLSAREIVLTGIDLSSYQDGEADLGDLLLRLSHLPARIRLGSLEERVITAPFLEKMRAAGNVAPHFHLSLQSGSDAVLRAMNRHYTREEYLRACALIYRYFPDAAITTDIIVGFPGETEEDFCDSLSIVRAAGFARVHAFPYSRREGTNAARLADLPASLKKERMARMLAACAEAEKTYAERFLGRTLTALFEEDGGYTQNYIRVQAAGAKEGGMYEVRLTKYENGGCMSEIVKQI